LRDAPRRNRADRVSGEPLVDLGIKNRPNPYPFPHGKGPERRRQTGTRKLEPDRSSVRGNCLTPFRCGKEHQGDAALIQVESTIPRYLYRFRAFQDEHESLKRILVDNRWYFGSRADFDDQQDCVVPGVTIDRRYLERLVIDRDESISVRRRWQIERLLADPNAGRSLAAQIQWNVDNVGMLCLSELDDQPELWRLYADTGHGVCLCLDTTRIVATNYYGERGPFQIKYSDRPKSPWNPHLDGDARLAAAEDHLLRKGSIWEYQKEWRFILHHDREKTVGEHPMPYDALSAIIFGRRLTEIECREVVTWIRSGPWNPTPKIYCREPDQAGHLL